MNLSTNLTIIMFQLFVEKYPDMLISKRVYEMCDSLFIKICAEKDENKINLIHLENKGHHMTAE